jgi:hypothetical protein
MYQTHMTLGMFAFMLNIHDDATPHPRKQPASSFRDPTGATAAAKSGFEFWRAPPMELSA